MFGAQSTVSTATRPCRRTRPTAWPRWPCSSRPDTTGSRRDSCKPSDSAPSHVPAHGVPAPAHVGCPARGAPVTAMTGPSCPARRTPRTRRYMRSRSNAVRAEPRGALAPALHGKPRSTFIDGRTAPSLPLSPPLPPMDPASARSTVRRRRASATATPPSVPASLGQYDHQPDGEHFVHDVRVWPAFTPMTFNFPCPITHPPASIALPTIVTFPFTPGM